MEHLSREALRLLMERASAIEARSGRNRDFPWAKRSTAVPEASGMVASAKGADSEIPHLPIGIERRLVRRAQARWASLRGDQSMPPASAAEALLAPPFASRAMCISFPATGQPDQGMARISHIGEALSALLEVPDGLVPADADPASPLPWRLAGMAAKALLCSTVCHLDSDVDEADTAAIGKRPHLLLRAVALPLAPGPDGVRSAIVIASWRTLLSRDETAALHRELAAAITWMRDQRVTA